MTEEERFKLAVQAVIERGEYPGPVPVHKEAGNELRRMNVMSGRECKWRAEVLIGLGWTWRSAYHRGGIKAWHPPQVYDKVGRRTP